MGVSVEIVLNDDEINRGGDTSLDFTDFLQAGGVLRWNDSKQLMHEKFCIIDDRIVITGSYNWTNKAELNSEVENFFYDEEETTKFYNELFIKLSVRFKQEPRAARNLEDKRRFFVEEYKRTMVRFKRIKRIANNKEDKRCSFSEEGFYIDEQGAKYSNDLKVLYKGADTRSFILDKRTREIKENAFLGFKHIEKIVLSSVVNVGYAAFKDCTSLQQVEINFSVKEIGSHTFMGCTSLRHVIFHYSIAEIQEGTFMGCTSLRQIVIPNSVKEIGRSAFQGCLSLQEIIVPDSVIEIGKSAFEGCSSLRQLTIPNSTKIIWRDAFFNCSSLKQLSIPDSIRTTGWSDTPDYIPLTTKIVRHMIVDRTSVKQSFEVERDVFVKTMSLSEKNMADSRNEDIVTTYAFSSRYHSPELYNLNDGEIITIPQNFTIFQHYVEQIKSEGRFSVSDKKAHAIEYINVLTNTGHIVEFHPLILLSSFAFEVDEYGRNIRENGHMVKSKIESEVTRFVSGFRNLTEAIRAMEGCQIKYIL